MDTTDPRIRDYQAADGEAVVALSLRAWAPVFASMEQVLGHEIFARLHGDDWRDYQAPATPRRAGCTPRRTTR